MKTPHALFFDIDGTLVSFKTHCIPTSTINALTQAKANGCRIYIATGRPINIITNLGDIEHLIDGYVTTNGARCFVGDESILLEPIPHDEAALMVKDATAHGYSLIVTGEHDLSVIDTKGDVDRIFRRQLAVKNLEQSKPIEEVMKQPILQLTPFFSAEYEATIMPCIPGCISGRWHPEFTDITAIRADKGIGLTAMAKHEDIPLSNTIAFGDGGNDLSMILTAGIGVAMGNAIDSLKQAADYITTSVDDDGIQNALLHFNIIPNRSLAF